MTISGQKTINQSGEHLKETAKIFGIKRMTVYRWIKTGKKSKCYEALLSKEENWPADGEDPKKNMLEIEDALQGLEKCRKHLGSWQKLANDINVDVRTIMRWRQLKKISPGYRTLLYHFFKEGAWKIITKR